MKKETLRSSIVLSVFVLSVIGCSSGPSSSGSNMMMVPKAKPVVVAPVETQPATQPTTQPSVVRAKSSPGAKAFFVDLKNGQTVTSPLVVKFGSSGVTIAKAGEVIDNTAHFHLLIDVETLPPMDQPLPFSDHILHFGQAQLETTVNLSPGPHTLQLVLAGGNHVPLDPPVNSEKIRVIVK